LKTQPSFFRYSFFDFDKWRAPEEYNQVDLNQQIDVWSMGMSMYVLLTGVKPHNDIMHKYKKLTKVKQKGGTPHIDTRFEKRSFAEKKLIDIMLLCWKFDASKRISIFDLVVALRQAVWENHNQEKEAIS
jgi:serine/threonine protein kinase